MPNNISACRVCGYLLSDIFHWGTDGNTPSFDICPCCGVEFGYEDVTIEATKKYREQWLKNGAIWFDPKQKPNDWALANQMLNIPHN